MINKGVDKFEGGVGNLGIMKCVHRQEYIRNLIINLQVPKCGEGGGEEGGLSFEWKKWLAL